jgi:hypothetical protein
LLVFPLSLSQRNLNAVVEYLSDEGGLRHLPYFALGNLDYVLGFGRFFMEERHKDANLHHVHELAVKGLLQYLFVGTCVLQDLSFVLTDQEGDSHALRLQTAVKLVVVSLGLLVIGGGGILLRFELLVEGLQDVFHFLEGAERVVILLFERFGVGKPFGDVFHQGDREHVVREERGRHARTLAHKVRLLNATVLEARVVICDTLGLNWELLTIKSSFFIACNVALMRIRIAIL